MADIETLLGLRTRPGADMRALAAELRGQADLGDVLALSGSEAVQQLGASQRARALGAAQRGGVLSQAVARDRESRKRWEEERATRAGERAAAFAEREEQRQYERSRLGEPVPMRQADGSVVYMQYDPQAQTMVPAQGTEGLSPWVKPRAGGTGLRPGAKERENTRKSAELVEDMNELNRMYEALSPEQRDQLDSPKMEIFSEMLPDDARTYLKSQYFNDKGVQNYLSKLSSVEAALSKVQAGLSVTGFEMSDRKRWSPNAPGLGQRNRNERIRQLQEDLAGEVAAFNRYYGDYRMEQPKIYGLDLDAPPPLPPGGGIQALGEEGQIMQQELESTEDFIKRMTGGG